MRINIKNKFYPTIEDAIVDIKKLGITSYKEYDKDKRYKHIL